MVSTNKVPAVPSAERTAITFGFWSSILATVFTLLFDVFAIAFPAPEWRGIEDYAQNFNSLQMASFVPALLLAPTLVILMISIHNHLPADKRTLTLIGVAFSATYATIVCLNYYVQLFVVRLNLLSGDLEGLAILAMPNFHSAFFALEAIGYTFLSLATLFVGPVFTGGKLESWIRWLFIANGLLGLFGAVVALFDQPIIILASLGIWSLLFPISTILVAIYFRNARRGTAISSY